LNLSDDRAGRQLRLVERKSLIPKGNENVIDRQFSSGPLAGQAAKSLKGLERMSGIEPPSSQGQLTAGDRASPSGFA